MTKVHQESPSKLINKLYFRLTCIGFVAVTWVLLFKLNQALFNLLDVSNLISLVFLPTGLRLIAVMLFNFNAFIGLFIGSFITSPTIGNAWEQTIVLSFISAISPYLACKFSNYLLNINITLIGLTTRQLLLMSLTNALFNAILHNLYFYFSGLTTEFVINTSKMLVGDLLGALLILYTLSFSIKLIRKIWSHLHVNSG